MLIRGFTAFQSYESCKEKVWKRGVKSVLAVARWMKRGNYNELICMPLNTLRPVPIHLFERKENHES